MNDRPAAATLFEAARAAGYAPSIHNTQPWRWMVHDDVLDLYADRSRQLPETDSEGRLLTISCGTALHHAVVALAAEGWTAEIERIPSNDPDLLARLTLSGGADVTPEAMHTFQNLRLRHTDRRPVGPTPPDPSAVQAVRAAATIDGVDAQVLTEDQIGQLGAACARADDEIQIDDPMQRLELAYWVGGGPAAGSGMDLNLIPAGSAAATIPGRDFVRTGALTARGARTEEGPAAYLMLSGGGDEPADWVRAGEALCSGWLEATGLGLSVLPFSSIIEVSQVRDSLRQDLLAGNGNPYIVVRLGVPSPDHSLDSRTPRLPAEQTIAVDNPNA
jgi:hypothetical protein